MNKFGPYFQRPGYGEDILDAWPTAPGALFMDIDGDFIAWLRNQYPWLEITVRMCEPSGEGWRGIAARVWAQRMLAAFRGNNPDYVVNWTLPLGHDHTHLFADFDQWQVDFANEIRPHGIEPIGCCIGTGNFTARDSRIRIPDAFPKTCEAYSVLGPQCYDWPDLRRDPAGHALRLIAWHDDIKASLQKEMQFIVMECGLTQAVHENRPDHGWRDDVPDAPTDGQYVDTMSWANAQWCQLDYVKYAFVYLFHDYNWPTFRHHDKPEVWHKIRDFDAPDSPPEEPPEEPPQEEPTMDEPKVVDLEYKERDFQYAKDKYGVAYCRAVVQPGQLVYRLVELWEKTGNHSLITQVLDGDGNPLGGVDVAFYWPDAPLPPDPATETYDHDWYKNFVHGLTNMEKGEVGPGMGKGAYHGEGEGGPHAVWVRDPDIPSDICEKLGMLAGTNHDHLDQKFMLVVEPEAEGEPPEEPGGELVIKDRQEVTPWASAEMILCYPKDMAYDTRGQARIVGVPPEGYDPDLELPAKWMDDDYYVYVKNCCDFGGDAPRTYQLMVTQYGSSDPITPVAEEEFRPSPDYRCVIFYVDYSGEAPPEEPPVGDLGGLFEQLAANDAMLAAAFSARAGLDAAIAEALKG